MNVLLFSMPDSFEHTPSLAMRMPNGALASLAGNVDPHHDVAIADLVLVQHVRAARPSRELVTANAPDIVGLSVMTFQRKTARKVIALVRSLRPRRTIVVGGYDPSLAPDAYEDPSLGVDVIVRGEGDLTFRELLRALERGARLLGDVAGSCTRDGGDRFVAQSAPARQSPLADETFGRRIARRGCSRATRCSAGRSTSSRRRAAARTTAASARSSRCAAATSTPGRSSASSRTSATRATRGARAIFLVDDNITLNVARFRALCEAIIDAGLNDIDYIVQGDDVARSRRPATSWQRAMRAAGFRYVFLGIENVLDQDLAFLQGDGEERPARRRPHDWAARPTRAVDAAAPARHARRRRPHRRQSRRHARVDRREPRLRAQVRRLAVHPASDAVSRARR